MVNFIIRNAEIDDAEGILKVHFSAVNVTAANDYDSTILSEWSPPVTEERIEKYKINSFPSETTIVAVNEYEIIGFGSIVESDNELRAIYVHSNFGRNGVGVAILEELEKIARERGCKEIRMDSSITAAKFYSNNGYKEVERGHHKLSSGKIMACVKMIKDFE